MMLKKVCIIGAGPCGLSQLRAFQQAESKGEEIPEWFSYPEVISELQKQRPSLSNRGFTIFFTGLSFPDISIVVILG